jgi:cephalosporin hydroxylase
MRGVCRAFTGNELQGDRLMSSESPQSSIEPRIRELEIHRSYSRSKYLSLKHSSYFYIYEELLQRYRGRPVVFVEIGVLNGGSLFMWRDYFGPGARIIGVDLNPQAKRWEQDGFEIHIGNQADPAFWRQFFAAVGDVDVILDDGGHTNEQQIVTSHESLPHIRDGGVLIVEDTHCSYSREFGNPSRYSFMSYAKDLVDSVNSRFPLVHASNNELNRIVFSVGFYESIVSFHVDRSKCFVSWLMRNEGASSNAEDFRHRESVVGRFADVGDAPGRKSSRLATLAGKAMTMLWEKWRSRRLRGYFGR